MLEYIHHQRFTRYSREYVGAINPIECGGLENLFGAGGGLQKPPHLSEVLLVPLTQKMVPNPKTRQDKDVTT